MCCVARKTIKSFGHGHDNLSTYGIGKDKSVEDWRILGRRSCIKGLVEQLAMVIQFGEAQCLASDAAAAFCLYRRYAQRRNSNLQR